MLFYHGTTKDNISNIKKNGLLDKTCDQWIIEVTQRNVCCISSTPVSGEGGNPIYFARKQKKIKKQKGFLVVIKLEENVYQKKLVTIFDNKTLDDYVRYHFFVREEFRHLGHELYRMLKHTTPTSLSLAIDEFLQDKKALIKEIKSKSTDQKEYYREEHVNGILKLREYFGSSEWFLDFLDMQFSHVDREQYEKFRQDHADQDNGRFWRAYYETFPRNDILDPRCESWKLWFSPAWLDKQKLDKVTDNCQILTEPIEPEYIVDYMQVTSGSSLVQRFRPKRQHERPGRHSFKVSNKIKQIAHQIYKEKKSL